MSTKTVEYWKKRLAQLQKIKNPNDWDKNQIRHAKNMISEFQTKRNESLHSSKKPRPKTDHRGRRLKIQPKVDRSFKLDRNYKEEEAKASKSAKKTTSEKTTSKKTDNSNKTTSKKTDNGKKIPNITTEDNKTNGNNGGNEKRKALTVKSKSRGAFSYVDNWSEKKLRRGIAAGGRNSVRKNRMRLALRKKGG